jgi:hypothetical protein
MNQELIEIVARKKYEALNDDKYDDQSDYIKGMWHDYAVDAIYEFELVSDILKNVRNV